jgi:anti-sigma factor RsiW
MRELDNSILVAYVDGELDAETEREVAAAIAADSHAQDKVRAFRESNRIVQAAFQEPAEESAPAPLMAAAGPPGPKHGGVREWRFALPLAASLAILAVGLGAGLGTGYMAGTYRADDAAPVAAKNKWLEDMVSYYQVLAADQRYLIEAGADNAPYAENLVGAQLERPFRVPDLSQHGLTYRGVRFMPIEGQPAVLLVYDLPNGKPLGICMTFTWLKGRHAPTPTRIRGMNLVYWADPRFAYALMGTPDSKFLATIAPDIARQLEAI